MSVSTSSSAASEHYWAAALFLAQPIGARWALGLEEPVAAGARSALGADVGAGPGQGVQNLSPFGVLLWGAGHGAGAAGAWLAPLSRGSPRGSGSVEVMVVSEVGAWWELLMPLAGRYHGTGHEPGDKKR